MRSLRINGIVRVASRLRRSLGASLTEDQLLHLQRQAREALAQVDSILSRHSAGPGQLPPPSRRAYEYLRQVGLRTADGPHLAQPIAGPGSNQPPARREAFDVESIWFPGLRSFLNGLLDDMARQELAGKLNAASVLKVIQGTAGRLNHLVASKGMEPGHLKPEARQLLGWFRFFSDQAGLERYVTALRQAGVSLTPLLAGHPRWRAPVLIHYRPSSLLYSIHARREGTRLVLDTPMMTFDAAVLSALGRRILGEGRHQKEMMAAMMSDPYQQMVADLQAAAGIVERTRGLAHDLSESFERVNREYFAGQLRRPALTWSRTLTGRKFGHYDFIHDRVCISSTLDSAEVPAFVVDHVMHHELLHKKHGFRFRGARQHAHTPEFRSEERQFTQFREADAFLNQLSRRLS